MIRTTGPKPLKTLRFILGDQLSEGLSSLRDADPGRDVVLMVEVADESTYVRHHKQKIALVLSAMRHFAKELSTRGFPVDYVRLDDPSNSGSFTGELARALRRHAAGCVVVTEPGEWRVRQQLESWASGSGIPLEVRDDDRFLCSRAEFAAWAHGKKVLRMEFFYREMRRKTKWLMAGDAPMGGQWNYDAENRKALPRGTITPRVHRFRPDAITREVLELVRGRFAEHFGDLEPFGWPVTRSEAVEALREFIVHGLPQFGDYQDAMQSGEDFLFHSALSPALNIGLLGPTEVCEAALKAFHAGRAPLHSVEGFVRQIAGWREFVRGIYWRFMPDYARTNFFAARRPLPSFYWSGETPMRCLREVISSVRRNAYAHHIQRLMVTGNFALLAGLEPAEVEEWYLAVFADAFDWVELPNTHGMVLHADGGVVGSKPYAASGAYIDRMSDYCRGCAYDVKAKLGENACPFNFLYWDFLARNRAKLGGNPRMAMPYRNLDRMPDGRREAIAEQAEAFLSSLGQVLPPGPRAV